MGEVSDELAAAIGFIQTGADCTEEAYAYLKSLNMDPKLYCDHLWVLEAALLTHRKRYEVYGHAWKDFGMVGNILNLARKGKRAWAVLFKNSRRRRDQQIPIGPALDDALDCINYAAFAIRCVAEENMHG